ncbi:phage tail tube protein [Paenibacillus sp. FSL R5-0908]|uniref:phage tail tube protein n=1 Tax=Paenibacillus sp. FSL R5-0908 TaxID=2921664 RepID=UPI0030FB31D0
MSNVDANKVINGTYGFLYDEDGREMDTTSEFEVKDEYEKKEMRFPGDFHSKHKVMGGKITGKIKFSKIDSRLQQKIAADPTVKFNYIGKLADPNSDGEEAVLIRGVSFDSNPIMSYKTNEIVEVDINFTADDYEYKSTIG